MFPLHAQFRTCRCYLIPFLFIILVYLLYLFLESRPFEPCLNNCKDCDTRTHMLDPEGNCYELPQPSSLCPVLPPGRICYDTSSFTSTNCTYNTPFDDTTDPTLFYNGSYYLTAHAMCLGTPSCSGLCCTISQPDGIKQCPLSNA